MPTNKLSKEYFLQTTAEVVESLFLPAQGRLFKWIEWLWLALLYLLGVVHWVYFLNWGKVPFDLHDWPQAGAYFSFLRQAVLTNRLPLHIGSTLSTTDRYLARPDTLISPQIYLLRFLEPGPFFLVNTLILFTVGCLGLYLMKRRYALSVVALTVLFILFNFNGNLTAHIAVGHSVWTGYFLLPLVALLVLKVTEGEKAGWTWVLFMSLTLFAMTLQGSFHFFLWCLIFLLAWGVFAPRFFLPATKVIIFSLLLSLFRLLPPAIEFIGGGKEFISGFPTVADLFSAMLTLKYPAEALAWPFKSLGWWELDMYIGLLGFSFLAFFGLYQTWRRQDARATLLAPIAVLTFLSIGQIYSVINRLPIPLTDSERISSRFFILPLIMLIILGSIFLQEFLGVRGRRALPERVFSLALLALMLHDLLQHSRIWRVTNMYSLFQSTPADIRSPVVNHPDPVYFVALSVGAATTVITLTVLVVLALRERRYARQLDETKRGEYAESSPD